MSAAKETAPLHLDVLADEVIRTHGLVNGMQPVAAAVQDFARQVGPERMIAAYHELIAEKIRQRVTERAQEAPRLAPPARTSPQPRDDGPARPQPAREAVRAEPEEPEAREEFRPGAVLRHTTESSGYDGEEAVTSAVDPVPVMPARQAPPIPDVLAGLMRRPEVVPEPGETRPKVTVRQQPSRRMASMRATSPEETWGALADMIDVGGTSKQRKDLTDEDLTVIIGLAGADEREHARLVTEAYQRKAKASMERDALRTHGVKSIGELPDHALNRLYARREP